MQQIYYCNSIDELPALSKEILFNNTQSKIFLFHGNLGAGKTTFIKQLCLQLGYQGEITSPTFSIINHYMIGEKQTIYHMDLYRLKDEEEALEIGLEEYLYNDQYCFIEWPQLAENLLTESFYKINIEVNEHHERKIEVAFFQIYG